MRMVSRGLRMFVAPLLVFQLGASVGASEAPLTLATAVKQALECNPEVQQLQCRLRAMEAKAKQAPYLGDPQIAFQLGGVPLSNPTDLNQADANSIGIRQMLPFFGKLGLKENPSNLLPIFTSAGSKRPSPLSRTREWGGFFNMR